MSDGVEVAAPWEEDKFGRQGIAKFLTNYLDKNEDIKVLNINAPWGTGKTFFLTNWRNELNQTRVCLYFNAWENDFCGDPFIALSAVLYEGLKKECPGVAVSEFKDAAKKAIVAATPALMKGVVKNFLSVDIDEIVDALGDAAEKAVEKLIQDNNETLDKVRNFKASLEHLSRDAAAQKASRLGINSFPVYIFIDELDRCRPTYAIELLERLKHFFDVKNCRFVVATDTEQMVASVKSVYGEGFDSFRYLRRFFDSEYRLDNSDIKAWVIANACFEFGRHRDLCIFSSFNEAQEIFGASHMDLRHPEADALLFSDGNLRSDQLIVLALAQAFRLELRELNKIIRHIKMVESNIEGEFEFFWAAYLVVLKHEAPSLYWAILKGKDASKFSEIKALYRNTKLYVGFASLGVHDMAKYYFDLLFSGEDIVRSRYYNGDFRNSDLRLIVSFFVNNTASGAGTYIELVNLARSE